MVLVREHETLTRAFAHEQGYLPHQQHELHAVDITLEYSRPFRALKLWLAFRAHGAPQFREAIAQNLHEADLLYRTARDAEDFETMAEPPQLSIVPIRHAPAGVADLDAHNEALGEGDPAGRPRVPGLRAHRRPGVAAAVLRQLPHDRGRRRWRSSTWHASWVSGSPRRAGR